MSVVPSAACKTMRALRIIEWGSEWLFDSDRDAGFSIALELSWSGNWLCTAI
jgi:hypothetical protein